MDINKTFDKVLSDYEKIDLLTEQYTANVLVVCMKIKSMLDENFNGLERVTLDTPIVAAYCTNDDFNPKQVERDFKKGKYRYESILIKEVSAIDVIGLDIRNNRLRVCNGKLAMVDLIKICYALLANNEYIEGTITRC